jgi:hypothetical protein
LNEINGNFDPEKVHYATEVNLYRDFNFHKIRLSSNVYKSKVKEATPDIVIVYGKYVFIIECKVYIPYSIKSIEEQINNQKYLIDMLYEFYNIPDMKHYHLVMLPDEIRIDNGDVITWIDFYNFFFNKIKYLKEDEFINKILEANLNFLYHK